MNQINPDLAVLAAGALADLLDHVPAGAGEVVCARCGRPLAWGVATSEGVLGGDCLATVTGDQATRSRARRAERLIAEWGDFARVEFREYTDFDGRPAAVAHLYARGRGPGPDSVSFSGPEGSVGYALARWYADGRGLRRAKARR